MSDPRLIRKTTLTHIPENNLSGWSKNNGIPLNEVAKSLGYSISTVYKISAMVIGASGAFRLAFLKKYGPDNYKQAFGKPGLTDAIEVYMEVLDNA